MAQRFAGVGAVLCFIAAGLTMLCRVVLAADLDEDPQKAEEKNPSEIKSQPQDRPEQKQQYQNWGS